MAVLAQILSNPIEPFFTIKLKNIILEFFGQTRVFFADPSRTFILA